MQSDDLEKQQRLARTITEMVDSLEQRLPKLAADMERVHEIASNALAKVAEIEAKLRDLEAQMKNLLPN